MPPNAAASHLQQQPSTSRLAVPNSFPFIMSKQCWCPICDYFNSKGLELSEEKRALLVDDWGCDTVESLKLLESDDWDTIFDSSYKKVKLGIAKKLFDQLKEDDVDLSKCKSSLNFTPPEGGAAASTNSSSAKPQKKNKHTEDHTVSKRMEGFGFTHSKKKKKKFDFSLEQSSQGRQFIR